MAIQFSPGPQLREAAYREDVAEEYSFSSIFEYMVKNRVCEKLDEELQELKRKEARSWAKAREHGTNF